MNIYRHRFNSTCPNNGATIVYRLEIQTRSVLMVEDIVAACAVPETFHEPLADSLFEKFGGRQILRAFHHGVWIETRRGADARHLIGVTGSLTAAHRCAEPELHVHTWEITAWFAPPARVDARCYVASIDILIRQWQDKPLPLEIEWQEDMTRAILALVNCVEVEIRRADERVLTRSERLP